MTLSACIHCRCHIACAAGFGYETCKLISISLPGGWLALNVLSSCRVNKRGEAMMTNMNMTAHMHYDGIYY